MICDEFLARLHFIIFKQEFPRLSKSTKKIISMIRHWYLEEKITSLIIFGAIGAPHLLPTYVPDRLVLGEVSYQTILQGLNISLVKEKNTTFIPYGFQIGYYFLKDTTHEARSPRPPRILVPDGQIS
jgi:hypothetical protein